MHGRKFSFSANALIIYQNKFQREMPFNVFQQLLLEQKRIKLIQAYEKIFERYLSMKHVLTCCRNIFTVRTIFVNLLEMVSNIRVFVKHLMEEDNEDFIVRPPCSKQQPSVHGLDYLSADLAFILQKISSCIQDKHVHEHQKYDVLFELAHSIYNLLKRFESKYTSRIFNEV